MAYPKSRTTQLKLGAAVLALSAGFGGQALAQANPAPAAASDSSQVAEVVVTANKRGAETLQSVGASIGVIDSVQLKQRGVTDFMDITRNVPGLNVIDQGPGQKTIMIRGLTGAGESTVGLYYDGMPTSGSGDAASDASGRQADLYIYDAQRVEVLRGPQSTLYGSSALAGVVRVITNPADLNQQSAEMVVDGSSTEHGGGNYAVKGYVNMPMLDGRFALRVVGYDTHQSGFIDNTFLHVNNINSVDQQGLRLNSKLELTPNDVLTAQYFVQDMHAADEAIERPYASVIGNTPHPAAGVLQNDAHTRQPRYDHTAMASLNYEHTADKAVFSLSQSYFQRANTDEADNSPLYDFLTSVGFPSSEAVQTSVFRSAQETQMYTTEARVSTKLDGPVNGVAGVMYEDRTIHIDNAFLQSDPVSGNVIEGIRPWYRRTAVFKLDQLAAFGELTYDLTSKLALVGGVRVFQNQRHDVSTSIIPFQTNPNDPLPPQSVDIENSRETKAIFKGQLNYKVTSDVLLYASASQGYRAGGTILRIVPQLPPAYGPDYTWNYEMGAKTEWLNHRLILDANVYRINWYDMQVNGSYFDGTFSGILNCKGLCAHSQGAELDATARPMRGLDLTLATTLFKAQLDQAQPAVDGSPAKGAQLQDTPNFSLTTSANYSWPLTESLTGSVRADVQHMGEVPIMDYRPEYNIPGKAYTLVNLSATVASVRRWDFKIYARNVFDVHAQVNIVNDTADPGLVYTNQPRTVGVQVSMRY